MSVRKFYVRYREDMPETEMQASALYGFRNRGIETAPFYGFGDVEALQDLGPEVGLAGYIGDVWQALKQLGISRPEPLDYPEALRGFLGREVYRTNLKEIRHTLRKGMFVKPVEQKFFSGFVATGSFRDHIRLPNVEDEGALECWACDTEIPFVSEYRCFVLRGQIVSARHYKGDWGVSIDRSLVEEAVKAWGAAPVAYTLDFGATKDGRTLLVEANDGYAMGGYGISPEAYSAMLEARWEEMTSGVPWYV